MVGNVKTLPAGYEKIRDIDLKKNRREAIIVNATSAIIAVAMVLVGHAFVPVQTLFEMSGGTGVYIAYFVVVVAGVAAYVALHEAVHGVAMYHYCRVKPSFGFTGVYAYAGSAAFYNRRSYIVIALAPVVVWGVVLAVLMALVPKEWFWAAYFIQINNLAGAAGDLYVTSLMMRMPDDILVRDAGVSMEVFGKKKQA